MRVLKGHFLANYDSLFENFEWSPKKVPPERLHGSIMNRPVITRQNPAVCSRTRGPFFMKGNGQLPSAASPSSTKRFQVARGE